MSVRKHFNYNKEVIVLQKSMSSHNINIPWSQSKINILNLFPYPLIFRMVQTITLINNLMHLQMTLINK
jgi:hypothetical protein